jgi:N-acetylglucosaminyldiphosphoundecaprenol N-acetyl-beta-D-mannosaminyltransferase
MSSIPVTEILGVPVSALPLKGTVALAVKRIRGGKKALFTTINTFSIMVAQKNPEFLQHFKGADVVLPDGMGIVLAVRSLGKTCPERIAGPEFVDALLPKANENKFSVYFLGSTEENLRKIERSVSEKYPAIRVAGCYSPPHASLDKFNHDEIVAAINRTRPDILLVGMTAPKQELFLSRNFEKLDVSFMIGVGASFDYLAGVKLQCPKLIGRLGLEWLYRLIHSPKHVWKREVTIPLFIYHFFTKQFFARRKQQIPY